MTNDHPGWSGRPLPGGDPRLEGLQELESAVDFAEYGSCSGYMAWDDNLGVPVGKGHL